MRCPVNSGPLIGQTLSHRARSAHRPFVAHAEFADFAVVAIEHADNVFFIVFAWRRNRNHGTAAIGRRQAALHVRVVAVHVAENTARRQRVADFNARTERVAFRIRYVDHAWLDDLPAAVQRAQQAVVDVTQQSRTQSHRQLIAGGCDRVAGAQAGGILVDLYGDFVAVDANNLAEQACAADQRRFVQVERFFGACTQHRPADPADGRVSHQQARLLQARHRCRQVPSWPAAGP